MDRRTGRRRRGRRAKVAAKATTPPQSVCFSFWRTGSCSTQGCKYEHRANPQKGKAGKGGSRGSSAGSNQPKKAPGSIDVPCKLHAIGNCRHGAQCPFRHDGPAAPAANQKPATEEVKAKKKRRGSRKPKGGGNAPAAPAILKSYGQRCAAAVKFNPQLCGSKLEGANHGPIRWLADTGCAADLIGLNDMTADDLKYVTPATDPICFSSANGPVWATSTLPLQGVALMEEMNPFVM